MQSSFSAASNILPGNPAGHIRVNNAGKRFSRDWIFRRLNYKFEQGGSYAIVGPNGSGKSTLLQAIAGAIILSEGAIEYQGGLEKDQPENNTGGEKSEFQSQNQQIGADIVFNYLAIVAPYLEVIEEMTGMEFLRFHTSFKPLLSTIPISEILEIVGLTSAAHKQIRFYSSGMKQRIKLAQAIFADVPILLLDEPCTNLDTPGYKLYHQLIEKYCKDKLVIVSSNDVNEYDFCGEKLNILDYKNIK